MTSRLATLGLLLALGAHSQTQVTTWRNNPARSGENLHETILTPANVNPTQFGKLFEYPVDGQVYAQPLYLTSVPIPGKGIHNVIFIATAHDTVYAFDADSNAGPNAAPLWQVSLFNSAADERPVIVDDVHCDSMTPETGITGTPVIDPASGTLYVIAVTIQDGVFTNRLHALDVSTGAEKPGSPITIEASVPGAGDGFSSTHVVFHSYLQKNRASLLLLNGVVYTAWTSYCDSGSYHGWIIGYDAASLQQVAVFNSSPNSWQSSFWMGGAAPAADSDRHIYAVTGNGLFDPRPRASNFGDSVLKLSSTNGLALADYFTPFNQLSLNRNDLDLGASGPVLLPDAAGNVAHPHLLVSGGKEGRIYLLDRDQLGGFHDDDDSQIVQSLEGAIGPLYCSPAYFNGSIYFSASSDSLKAFPITSGRMGTAPTSQTAQSFGYPGTVPAISASGSSNGILWILEGDRHSNLHAYDSTNLGDELYNSQMSGARDLIGPFVRFTLPVVANGKVYAGTANSVAIFGLLNQPPRPVLSEVLDAASMQSGPVAPGSLISILGANLGHATASSENFSNSLDGVTLSINGIPAPLRFVSPRQINAQLPPEVALGLAIAELHVPGMPPVAIKFMIQ